MRARVRARPRGPIGSNQITTTNQPRYIAYWGRLAHCLRVPRPKSCGRLADHLVEPAKFNARDDSSQKARRAGSEVYSVRRMIGLAESDGRNGTEVTCEVPIGAVPESESGLEGSEGPPDS